MLKKFKKKIQINLTKKTFNKVNYKGKLNFNLTNRLFKQLITAIMRLSQQQRRVLKYKIYKKLNRFKLNRRFFFGKKIRKNIKIIKYFFFSLILHRLLLIHMEKC